MATMNSEERGDNMPILVLNISYPDFKLNEIINPDEFDLNNKEIVDKINEIITSVNEQFGSTIIPYPDSSVITAKLADSSVTNIKIADGAITVNKITDDSITTPKILDGSVVESKIADGVVTTVKIADLNVTTGKLANLSVTTEKLANLSVTTDKINGLAVTDAKLAQNAVTTSKIADLNVTTAKLAANAITSEKILNGSVTSVKLDPAMYASLTNVYSKSQSDAMDALNVKKAFKTGSTTVYKVLSDNNFTDAHVSQLSEVYPLRHSHANKALLDAITSTDIAGWNGGNYLSKTNTTAFTPSAPYHPATMKYVQDTVVSIGSADMQKSVYDTTNKSTDIYEYADNVRIMTDASTGKRYILGVDAGGLYYKEVL